MPLAALRPIYLNLIRKCNRPLGFCVNRRCLPTGGLAASQVESIVRQPLMQIDFFKFAVADLLLQSIQKELWFAT